MGAAIMGALYVIGAHAEADQAATSAPITVTSEVPAPVVTVLATLSPVTSTATITPAPVVTTVQGDPVQVTTTAAPVTSTATVSADPVVVTKTATPPPMTITETVSPDVRTVTATAAPTMAPCESEDGSTPGQTFPCVWNGATMGNGTGDSYVLTESM